MRRDNPGTSLQPTLPAQTEFAAWMGDQLVPQAGARCTNGLWVLPPWGTIQLAANKQVPTSLALCLLFLSSQHIILQDNNQPNKHPACFPNGWQVMWNLRRKGRDEESSPTHCHSRDLTFCKGCLKTSLPTTAMPPLETGFQSHPVWQHYTAPPWCQCSSTATALSTKTQDLSLEEAVPRTAKKNKASKGNGRLSDCFGTHGDGHSKLPWGNLIPVKSQEQQSRALS